MRDEYIRKFYNEVKETLDGDYKIILEPPRNLTEEWIEYDQVEWKMEHKTSQKGNRYAEQPQGAKIQKHCKTGISAASQNPYDIGKIKGLDRQGNT